MLGGILLTALLTGGIYLFSLGVHESGVGVDWREVEVEGDVIVCSGVLTLKGRLKGEAVVGLGDLATFSIYRRSELRPGYTDRGVEPVLSFLEPLGPGEFYTHMSSDMQIADRLVAVPHRRDIELVSPLPDWISSDPSGYEITVWGYPSRTASTETGLGSGVLKACPEG